MESLLDERAAAQFLGVSVQFLQQDRHKGARIPFVKVGRAVRYQPDDLRAFVRASTIARKLAHPADAESQAA